MSWKAGESCPIRTFQATCRHVRMHRCLQLLTRGLYDCGTFGDQDVNRTHNADMRLHLTMREHEIEGGAHLGRNARVKTQLD
eukprot:2264166-Pleurochrysis_carterae.AAC.1